MNEVHAVSHRWPNADWMDEFLGEEGHYKNRRTGECVKVQGGLVWRGQKNTLPQEVFPMDEWMKVESLSPEKDTATASCSPVQHPQS